MGSCTFCLVHPDTKQPQEVTFYVASNNGSVSLSCATTLALGLIQSHIRLDYLPPRASLITSSADHPKKTKCQPTVHVSTKENTKSNQPHKVPKLITSKDQILQAYPEVLMELDIFLVHPTTFRSMQASPRQTPCRLVPFYPKKQFRHEIDDTSQNCEPCTPNHTLNKQPCTSRG